MIKKFCISYICDKWHETTWTQSLLRVKFDAFIFLKQKVFSYKRRSLKKLQMGMWCYFFSQLVENTWWLQL